ncbi:MAG: TraR/DksA C4-type zinc finger protein [Tepidisphaerales bacterium]
MPAASGKGGPAHAGASEKSAGKAVAKAATATSSEAVKPGPAASPAPSSNGKTAASKAAGTPPAVKAAGGKSGAKPPPSGTKPEPPKPVITAKPGQILLTPLRPSGSKPAAPQPKPAAAASEPAAKPAAAASPPPAADSPDSKPRKNVSWLSAKDLEMFRELLLAKRREILGDMSSMEREALRGAGTNLSNLPIHMADMGTDNYEQEFTLDLVEKDRQLLREINLALAKIQNGTYGICEATGKPISRARLEAQPWSKYSIEYVRELERRKQFGR